MTDDKSAEVRRRAADDLIRLSNMFKGLIEVGQYMKSMADLEQAAHEAEVRIERAENTIKERQASTLAAMEQERTNHETNLARQREKSQADLSSALASKKSELARTQEAHSIVSASLTNARSDLNDLSTKIAEAKSKLEGLGEQIEEKVKALKTVQDQHKALVASITNIR